MKKSKTPRESSAISTHVVLPDDTNALGNLAGGRLLQWIDMITAVAAHRHSNQIVVTVSVNHVSFHKPIKLGSIVTLEAKVSRAFRTSMEVYADVWVEDRLTGERVKHNEAIYTFVAVDQHGKPAAVPEIIPETEEEKKRFAAALRRRQLSLILAGKIKPADASELKALFAPQP